MRNIFAILVITLFLFACANNGTGEHGGDHNHDSSKQTALKDTSKKSIPSEASQQVGSAIIKINYHSPGVRGRVIWGGLVPYDEVWVTGAHKATTLTIDRAFQMGGKQIPAGKYALFTIPGQAEWTIILNTRWDQHLADDYSQAEDVVRLKVRPQTSEGLQERLNYAIDPVGERSARITMRWDRLSVPFDLEIQ